MKRIIALLTALMLCAAMLMGCGGGKEEVAGKTAPLNEQAESAAPKSELTATTEPTAEPEAEEHELSLGRMEGGVYENSYAGFGCKLDSNWTFYGAEELQEIPDAVQEGIEGSELGDAMKDYQTFTDMMAENAELLGTMNVQYVKIGVKERLVYAMLSEDDLIDMMLEEQKDILTEAYEQAGITVKSMEKVEVTYLGETHKAMYTVADMSGVESYMIQILDYTRGQYGITLTVASYIEDRTQEILDLFYKVE